MRIQYLGHAGFLVETDQTIVLCDAWLSNKGAFDSAWFQYPCNHHLWQPTIQYLQYAKKKIYVYVSHEHKDHFDIDFLSALEFLQFDYLLPNFRRSILRDKIADFSDKNCILFNDEDKISIDDITIQLFLDDGELNRDSGILIIDNITNTIFFNINDCKIFDRLHRIKEQHQCIDIFTCQFSGATWHPTCYEYDKNTYQDIAGKKNAIKFKAVANAMSILQPSFYIPSAGPACFLTPDLFHINEEPINIFPDTEVFLSFLEKEIMLSRIIKIHLFPEDELSYTKVDNISIIRKHEPIKDKLTYLLQYQKKTALSLPPLTISIAQLIQELIEVFTIKLNHFLAATKITIPLYIGFLDIENNYIRIDFVFKKIEITSNIKESEFYTIRAHANQFQRVLDGYLTWEDFALSFRLKLNRTPDVYQTLIQGFLILESEDLNYFSKKIIERSDDKITIVAGGSTYLIDKYCPHQLADLEHSWIANEHYIICPRHGWKFDLQNNGKCTHNNDSINAVCLDDIL